MDTLKAIQVFVSIAQHGNLTKAAEHLNYSRAMVSRYLEHLEHTFSTRLFQRNTRKISLTPAGEKLCSTAKIFYSSNNFYKNSQRLNNTTVQSVLHADYFYLNLGLRNVFGNLRDSILIFSLMYT